jgi:hypothetical protein
MSSRATSSAQSIFQARRELAMVQRIVTTISILALLGVPYLIFMFISFITDPPKYHFRISIFFADLAQTFIMLALFKFSQPVMDILWKFRRMSLDETHSESI